MKMNQIAYALQILSGSVGNGGYGVITGLDISSPGALNVVVSPGIGLVDGVVELIASGVPVGLQTLVPAPLTLTDNALNFVWLTQSGGLASNTTVGTPPTNARILLANVTTSAGVVTNVDYSGRITVSGNVFQRKTGDPWAPSDIIPSSVTVQTTVNATTTSQGIYNWNGVAHVSVTPQTYFATLSADLQLTAQANGVILYLTAASTNRNVKLPDTTTIPAGWNCSIFNAGTSHSLIVCNHAGTPISGATVDTTNCTLGVYAYTDPATGLVTFPGGTWAPGSRPVPGARGS
jgi:hypothetical protein